MGKGNYYIEKEEILKEIKQLKKTKNISDRLGSIIFEIASRYASRGKFYDYTWKDDMISDAVLTCFLYIDNFDTERENANPFAYITTICHRAFINFIKRQKKHSIIKDICYKNFKVLLEEDQYSKKTINYELLVNKDE